MTCPYYQGSRSSCLRPVSEGYIYCRMHTARIYDDAMVLQEKNEARHAPASVMVWRR